MEGYPNLLYSFEPKTPNQSVPEPPGPSQPKTRNKLGSDGIAILEAYWLRNPNPTQLPPLNDRKQLTKAIQELPGGAFWSDARTNDWFRRRMKRLLPDSTYIYPTLLSQLASPSPSKDALQHLSVLLENQPNPSSDVIKTWAILLARDGGPGAIEYWIGYISDAIARSPTEPSESRRSESAKLLTPSDTVTPEPHSLLSQSPQAVTSDNPYYVSTKMNKRMKLDPADSPTVASLSIRTQLPEVLPSSSSSSSSTSATVSPVSPFSLRAGQPQLRGSLRVIIEDAMQTFPHRESIGPLPSTPDEFVEMFAPYEDKLTRLQKILDSE